MNKLLPILILLLFLLARGVWSQSYPLQWYSTSDGLPHSSIVCLQQDKDGYIWIGTKNGVSRYDGNGFRNFCSLESGLADKRIRSIVLDSTGTGIWCNADEEGLYHIDRYGDVTRFARLVNGVITYLRDVSQISSGENHSLWITTAAKNILQLSAKDGIREFTTSRGYDFGKCRYPVWYAPRRELWFVHGHTSVGILQLDGRVRYIDLMDLIPKNVKKSEFMLHSIVRNHRTSGLWILTSDGLFTIEGDAGSFRFFRQQAVAGYVYLNAATDSEGNLWYAQVEPDRIGYAYRKISWRDGSILMSIGRNNEFTTMLPFGAIMEDREGSVWIGSEGLAHLKSGAVLNYNLVESGFPVAPRNILHLPNGGGILSAWGGIYRIPSDPIVRTEAVYSSVSSPALSRVVQDPAGVYHWFHAEGGGFTFDGRNVTKDRIPWKWKFHNTLLPQTETNATLHDGTIVFLDRDRTDRLYFLTPLGDTSSVNISSARADGLPWNEVILSTRHYANGENRVFLCSERSLWEIIDRRRAQQYSMQDGLLPGKFPSLCEDSTGVVWIGFRSIDRSRVLTKFDGKRFVNYSMQDIGLNSPTIISICALKNTRDLALMTTDALYIVDIATMKVRLTLDERDGLYSELGSCSVDHAGNIWILGVGGVTRFDERFYPASNVPPKVILSSFSAGDALLYFPNRRDQEQLEVRSEKIEIRFSALTFQSRETMFRTKLDGLDEEWSLPSTERSVRYAKLQSGDYTFRVRAVDVKHRWESDEAVIAFSIPPPFYRTWWFILAANVLVIGFIFGIIRYRLAQALKMERMRSQIALDLHDEISSTLTSISFLSTAVVRELKESNPTTAQKARKIGETARGVIEMMSDIIWSLKPSSDTFADLGKRLGDMATELCESASINLHLNVPSTIVHIPLRMDRRRQLYLIAKEAIHNALKHSQCTELWITFRAIKKTFELLVEDNGRGINHARENPKNGTHSGLASMKKRAQECGAELFIEPRAEGGTRVRVVVKELG